MNIWQKDLKTMWRSPMMWLVLAVISFILGWLFWQMIDRYNSLQASFMALPNPPTITQTLWVPFVLMLAKLMMLVVAFTTGQSYADEMANRTLWYLMINRNQFLALVWAKFKAQLLLLLFVLFHLCLVGWLLATGGTVDGFQMMLGMLGFGLFMLWLIALGQFISCHCQSSGTAVLLNVVVFAVMWMLGGDVVSQDYGLNWLVLLSPAQHLRWFCDGQVAMSSLVYFVLGTGLFLWLTSLRLKQVRQLW